MALFDSKNAHTVGYSCPFCAAAWIVRIPSPSCMFWRAPGTPAPCKEEIIWKCCCPERNAVLLPLPWTAALGLSHCLNCGSGTPGTWLRQEVPKHANFSDLFLLDQPFEKLRSWLCTASKMQSTGSPILLLLMPDKGFTGGCNGVGVASSEETR